MLKIKHKAIEILQKIKRIATTKIKENLTESFKMSTQTMILTWEYKQKQQRKWLQRILNKAF